MKFKWKTFLAALAYVLGVFGWFYLGIWQVFDKPLKMLFLAKMTGNLSIGIFFRAIVQGFLCVSLAGGVWCIGYMLRDYFNRIK